MVAMLQMVMGSDEESSTRLAIMVYWEEELPSDPSDQLGLISGRKLETLAGHTSFMQRGLCCNSWWRLQRPQPRCHKGYVDDLSSYEI